MALQVYSFTQIVSNIATAMQSSATAVLNFTVGSVLRAISEATAGVVLWLQAIILQLLTLTRAATSVGSDLDSFMADFGFIRLAADAATGQVTFSRFTATMQAVVPIGATVQTADGTQSFAVTLDTTNSAYSAILGGYVILANTSSVTVPVQATVAGSDGNVQASTITVITTPIPGGGVDTVTNASAFTNGIDVESDPAFRARFVLYLTSLSRATRAAVNYAVTSLQQDVVNTLTENVAYDGSTELGFFYTVVDDGTGFPSETLLTNAGSAVEAVRPLCARYAIFAPVVLTANVTMVLTTGATYNHSAVVAAVTTALQDFINGLPLGTSLPYTQLAGVAYEVPGVINATGILLNSGTSDLTADQKHKINAGTVSVA
jgi:uncharacterized phage protein gp47/JayE